MTFLIKSTILATETAHHITNLLPQDFFLINMLSTHSIWNRDDIPVIIYKMLLEISTTSTDGSLDFGLTAFFAWSVASCGVNFSSLKKILYKFLSESVFNADNAIKPEVSGKQLCRAVKKR